MALHPIKYAPRVLWSRDIEGLSGGPKAIERLLGRIRRGRNPPDWIDHRLTDEHFPQPSEQEKSVLASVIAFSDTLTSEVDIVAVLSDAGYISLSVGELLMLRLENPELAFHPPIAAPGYSWSDGRYRWVPCLGSGLGPGIRLRIQNAGWSHFWTFAVKVAGRT